MGILYTILLVRYTSRMGHRMPETNIEKRIEKYWGSKTRQLNIEKEEKFQTMLQQIGEQFTDPNTEHPVKTLDFVCWLKPESLIEFLKNSYPYFKHIKHRFKPRIRFLAYMLLSQKKNLRQAYNSLNEEEYKLLGFKRKPTYELLREFIYERIGINRFPDFFQTIIQELFIELKKKKIALGKHVFQDATDIHSLKHDKEAEYSGYYKHSGYKLDVTLDAETDMPLYYTTMKITQDEGQNLIPSQKHLSDLGLQEETRVVDDKYATFPNIAYSETQKISLYYRIAKHWIYKKEGRSKEVKKLYQRHHREDDFKVNPDIDFMLRYLYKKGDIQPVGGYYRNQRIKQKKSKKYRGKCKKRSSCMEGFFGRIKNTTLLDDRPCKRGWKGFLFRAGATMLSLVFAALIRVQNGVYSNLTNVTYIT